MSLIEHYNELQLSLATKRKQLQNQDKKRKSSSNSLHNLGTNVELESQKVEPTLISSKNSNKVLSPNIDLWDEDISLSLFQSQLFRPHESTPNARELKYEESKFLCNLYTITSGLDFSDKIIQLSVSCCISPSPSLFTILTKSGNVQVFSLNDNGSATLLWKHSYFHPMLPVAIHMSTLSTNEAGVVIVGVFIITFNIDVKLLTAFLYAARVENDRGWNLLDVSTSNLLVNHSPLSKNWFAESSICSPISIYIKDVGFVLTVCIPFCSVIVSFRFSECLKNFLLMKTNDYIISPALRGNVRLSIVTKQTGELSSDCMAIFTSETSVDLYVMLLKFDTIAMAHMKSDMLRLQIRPEDEISVSNLTIPHSSNIIVVESIEKQSFILTFVLKGKNQVDGYVYFYLSVGIFSFVDRSRPPFVNLRKISLASDYTTWSIFMDKDTPLRQLLCKLKFRKPSLAPHSSLESPCTLSVFSVSNYLNGIIEDPFSEFSFTPKSNISAPFCIIISQNNTKFNIVRSLSETCNSTASVLFTLF